MPISLLAKDELTILCQETGILIKDIKTSLPFIPEYLRAFLPLRSTDKISEAKQPYRRS
jgi:hypothetical protein